MRLRRPRCATSDVSGSMAGCISFNLSSCSSSGISPLDAALNSLGVKACDPAAFGANNYLGNPVIAC